MFGDSQSLRSWHAPVFEVFVRGEQRRCDTTLAATCQTARRVAGVAIAAFYRAMTIKKLVAVVLGVRPRGVTRVPITPEFGVRVTLRAGDKLVHRDASG